MRNDSNKSIIVFLFDITRNIETEYAKCASFIEMIEGTDPSIELLTNYRFLIFSENTENEHLFLAGEQHLIKFYMKTIETNITNKNIWRMLKDTSQVQSLQEEVRKGKIRIYYHFRLQLEPGVYDIVNFSYYFLIKQKYERCSLTITDSSLSFKLAHYLWFESRKSRNLESLRLVKLGGVLQKLPRVGVENFEKFFPLLEITSDSYHEIFKKPIQEQEEIKDYFISKKYRYEPFSIFSRKQGNIDLELIKFLSNSIIAGINDDSRLKQYHILNLFKQQLVPCAKVVDFINTVNQLLEQVENISDAEFFGVLSEYIKEHGNQLSLSGIIFKLNPVAHKADRVKATTALLHVLSNGKINILPLVSFSQDDITPMQIMLQTGINFVNPEFSSEEKGKDKSVFDMSQVFETIRHMSLFSFYLFAQQIYYRTQKHRKPIHWEEAKKIIPTVDIYSQGITQIIENVIYHSELRKGYFSFRYYHKPGKNSTETSYHELLQKEEYADYFNAKDTQTDDSDMFGFLEMYISDYSHCGIIDTFKRNAFNSIGEMLDEEELGQFNHLTLKNFFDGSNELFWNMYHRLRPNILHYGLVEFHKNVKMGGGCFRLDSIAENKKSIFDSANETIDTTTDDCSFLKGTFYRILLPVKNIKSEPVNLTNIIDSSVEARDLISFFQEALTRGYRKVPVSFGKISSITHRSQLEKEEGFKELANQMILECLKIQEESSGIPFLCVDFSDEELGSNWSEAIEKTIYAYAYEVEKQKDKKNKKDTAEYIIIYNLKEQEMKALVSQFVVRYSMYGELIFYDNIWVYLYGENRPSEFILHGKDLAALKKVNLSLAKVRGNFSKWMTSLLSIDQINYTNTARPHQENVILDSDILPFSVFMQINDSGETLFEKFARSTLDTDIERRGFGTRIPNTHVRIGSKTHVTNFYEAELLFQNNYYVDRFAYLIANDLNKKVPLGTKVLLVGYANYSEMLVNRIQSILTDKVEEFYLICEDTESLSFIYLDRVKERESLQVAFIVPIGTTLTTHSKMLGGLTQALKSTAGACRVNLIYNTAVILVRNGKSLADEQEKLYGWEIVNTTERMISTKYIEPGIRYFIDMDGQWKNPLLCDHCYPEKLLEERPLLETNKSSVIPFVVLGLQPETNRLETESGDINQCKDIPDENEAVKENLNRVKSLMDSLQYGHIIRNENHFLYYFDTSDFYARNHEKINQWLKETVKKRITSTIIADEKELMYHFIITPIHHSNMGFVNAVNDLVFKGSAQIIRFEVGKEFRENIRTKYNHLRSLYNDLKDQKARIHFHFIDDTIVTGETVNRARSMIRSIFPIPDKDIPGKDEFPFIFSSIIILINRASVDTQKDYTPNPTELCQYLNLYISAIKNPKHFCFMCSASRERQEMQESSATIAIRKYWHEQVVKLEEHEAKVTAQYNRNDARVERHKKRMLRAHISGYQFNILQDRRADTQEVRNLILRLICDELAEKPQMVDPVIDYLKIFSSPMLSYRKSVREAIFKILLESLDAILSSVQDWSIDSPNVQIPDLELQKETTSSLISRLKVLCKYDSTKENTFALVLIMMKQLTMLNSNFIIRKENIIKIWKFYNSIPPKQVEKWDNIGLKSYFDKFELKYAAMVKQLVCLHNDEAKSAWFEYILTTGKEFQDEYRHRNEIQNPHTRNDNNILFKLSNDLREGRESDSSFCERFGIGENSKVDKFMKLSFLENNSILWKTIHDLERSLIQIDSQDRTEEQIDEKIDIRKCAKCNKGFRSHHKCHMFIKDLRIYGPITSNTMKGIDFHSINYNNCVKDLTGYYYDYTRAVLNIEINEEKVIVNGRDNFLRLLNTIYLYKFLRIMNCTERAAQSPSIKDNLDLITNLLKEIMGADDAFFSVRASRKLDFRLHVIGKSEVDMFSKSLNKAHSFEGELDSSYFTYQVCCKEPSNSNSASVYYDTYDKKIRTERNELREFEIFENCHQMFVIRFHNPLERTRKESDGALTLLFNRVIPWMEIRFKIRKILLLTNELNTFLNTNFNNDSIHDWIDAQAQNQILSRWSRKFNHNAGKDLEKVYQHLYGYENSEINQKVDQHLHGHENSEINQKVYQHLHGYENSEINSVWSMVSNVYIGNNFANYLNNKYTIKRQPDIHVPKRFLKTWYYVTLDTIFDKGFSFLLKNEFNCVIKNHKDELYKKIRLRICLEVDNADERYYKSVDMLKEFEVKYIIFELVKSAYSHSPGNRTEGISITLENKYLVIENKCDKNVNIEFLKQAINRQKLDYGGITLFTVQKLIKYLYNDDIVIDFNENSFTFTVCLPILENIMEEY